MSEAERRNARPSRTPAEGTPENMAPAWALTGFFGGNRIEVGDEFAVVE